MNIKCWQTFFQVKQIFLKKLHLELIVMSSKCHKNIAGGPHAGYKNQFETPDPDSNTKKVEP